MKLNYEEAVLRHKDTVYRIAFARCPCKQDAEDVFQEVFLKLYRCRKDFESDEHLRNWLIRVTLNFCKLLHRSAFFRKKAALVDTIADTAAGNILTADNSPDRETAEAVTAAVKALPEKYAAPIELFYFEEMSCREISAALKINEATVRTRLRRGREALKKKLKTELEVSDDE
ncbi:MAG: RNA polymerase sigma factor [Oscillospiraceae bacterium]|nr:RNA polymerase sigma factor [Oscillospiraceae bacterium]